MWDRIDIGWIAMQISRDVNPPRGKTLTAVRVDPGRVIYILVEVSRRGASY